MQKIIIKNFGPIKELELDIKNFNLFIGECASGKSLIGKLIYIFLSFYKDIYKINKTSDMNYRLFVKFITIFTNSYTNFEINFFYSDKKHIRFYQRGKDWNSNFSEELEESIKKFYSDNTKLSNSYKKSLDHEILDEINRKLSLEVFENNLTPIYFPTERNLFTVFNDCLDIIVSEKMNTSFLMMEFGKMYKEYSVIYNKNFEKLDSKITEYINKILEGYYKIIHGEELFLFDKGTSLRLKDLYAGQQQLLPSIIVLSQLIDKIGTLKNALIIFEEPELSLCPDKQKLFLELLVLIVKESDSKLLITTHSQNILLFLNNLIYNSSLLNKSIDVKGLIGPTLLIDRKDINIFLIKKNLLENIVDDEDVIKNIF